jgi:aldehyde:ferredoxin oxidoreductase
MEQVEIFGLDAMTTGVVLAWATEAQERGIISKKETMDIDLSWGDYNAYINTIRLIVEQPNSFYKSMAQGVEHASLKYGGAEYALSLAGNEMPGYHTGPASHLGVIIGTRQSHLDNAGYSLDQKVNTKEKPSQYELIEALISEEQWRQILSSLVVCFFARGIFKPDIVIKALQLSGFSLSQEDLGQMGKEIHRQKYKSKVREGFKLSDIYFPKRIFETASPLGMLDEKFLYDCLKQSNNIT